jgi:hypothetical protein
MVKSMKRSHIRIEILGRDSFWSDAVLVEWAHQHPKRKLVSERSGSYLIEADWLEDLRKIAAGCYSQVVLAPLDPSLRSLFRRFFNPESNSEK